nr:HU family DNA-binding protein [Parabacteroides goldsteinii]
MNKNELAKEIASRMSTTVTMTLQFLDTMNDVVGETLSRNETVLLQNFGHYMPWEQSERMGRNPRTGKECVICKRRSVKFKPGKGLIDTLNSKH